MARTFAFVQVDVFTDRVFGGNQLAVFFDLEPGALLDAEMQAIALEMNLAETTFVYPPTRADCVARARIFTPTRELPFAGHPTVGTTWVLANRGRVFRSSSSRFERRARLTAPSPICAPWRTPSRDMRVQLKDGRATRIEVGGGVVPVFEGVLTLTS